MVECNYENDCDSGSSPDGPSIICRESLVVRVHPHEIFILWACSESANTGALVEVVQCRTFWHIRKIQVRILVSAPQASLNRGSTDQVHHFTGIRLVWYGTSFASCSSKKNAFNKGNSSPSLDKMTRMKNNAGSNPAFPTFNRIEKCIRQST